MIDRYAVLALLNAGQTQVSVARQVGVSERTVRGIVCEGPLDSADDQAARRPGGQAQSQSQSQGGPPRGA